MRKMILLYGGHGNKPHGKYQSLIDGKLTCGYRDYARKFGEIIYMTPQKITKPWEKSFVDMKKLTDYINSQPDAVVWFIKHEPHRDKLLSGIKNTTYYYSCNAKNMLNLSCNFSLIDTMDRLKKVGKNGKLFTKGKDKDFWKPNSEEKIYDYIMVGKRGDKNELHFIERLNSIKEPRRVIWVGGSKFKNRVKSRHKVTYMPPSSPSVVRDMISQSKVGILFTELTVEGFPQTFLEMTMCGVPVVFNKQAPFNPNYFHEGNCLRVGKKHIVEAGENLLKNVDHDLCRTIAINNYSLEKSVEKSFDE